MFLNGRAAGEPFQKHTEIEIQVKSERRVFELTSQSLYFKVPLKNTVSLGSKVSSFENSTYVGNISKVLVRWKHSKVLVLLK